MHLWEGVGHGAPIIGGCRDLIDLNAPPAVDQADVESFKGGAAINR